MSKTSFVQEIPNEHCVKSLCGPYWRSLSSPDIHAAWGVAIVMSVLDGVDPILYRLARYLGTDNDSISAPLYNLTMNGVFQRGCAKIRRDRVSLRSNDPLVLGYYGGYAAGVTGPFLPKGA